MNKNSNYEVNLLKDTISNLNRLSQLVACLNFAIKKEYMEYAAGAILSKGNEYSLLLDAQARLNKYVSDHPTHIIDPLISINEIESTFDKSQEILALIDNLLDNFVTNKLNLDLTRVRGTSIGDFSQFAMPIIRSSFPNSPVMSRYGKTIQNNNAYGSILVGNKGANFNNSGYVYAPYVPLTPTDKTMDEWCNAVNSIRDILLNLIAVL